MKNRDPDSPSPIEFSNPVIDDDYEDENEIVEAEDEAEDLEGEEFAACIKTYFPLHDDDELAVSVPTQLSLCHACCCVVYTKTKC